MPTQISHAVFFSSQIRQGIPRGWLFQKAYSPVVQDVLKKLAGSLKRLERTLTDECEVGDHAELQEGRQDHHAN